MTIVKTIFLWKYKVKILAISYGYAIIFNCENKKIWAISRVAKGDRL